MSKFYRDIDSNRRSACVKCVKNDAIQRRIVLARDTVEGRSLADVQTVAHEFRLMVEPLARAIPPHHKNFPPAGNLLAGE
jgi:hypothetical protein